MVTSKRIIGRIIRVFFLICLAFWIGSIIKCEILTYRYGEEFDQLWKENTMLVDPEYWKVLCYADDSASVYFVTPNGSGGYVLFFVRNEEMWHLDDWGPSWSKSGSADDLIWPYIR